MTRPLLLLDVDGVINPYGTPEPPAGFTDHYLFPGEEPVRVNPAHGAWITEAGRVVDIAWASTWNEEANELLAPLLHIDPAIGLTRGAIDRVIAGAADQGHR